MDSDRTRTCVMVAGDCFGAGIIAHFVGDHLGPELKTNEVLTEENNSLEETKDNSLENTTKIPQNNNTTEFKLLAMHDEMCKEMNDGKDSNLIEEKRNEIKDTRRKFFETSFG